MRTAPRSAPVAASTRLRTASGTAWPPPAPARAIAAATLPVSTKSTPQAGGGIAMAFWLMGESVDDLACGVSRSPLLEAMWRFMTCVSPGMLDPKRQADASARWRSPALPFLGVLAADTALQCLERDRAAAALERLQGRIAHQIQDGPAAQLKLRRDLIQIDRLLEAGFRRKTLAPQAQSLFGARHGEVDDGLEAPGERLVDIILLVRGEDGDAVEGLDALEQERDFLVGVAVVRILGLAALPEERVGLVEEQDPALVLCLVEDARKVLLGLADVLRDYERE